MHPVGSHELLAENCGSSQRMGQWTVDSIIYTAVRDKIWIENLLQNT